MIATQTGVMVVLMIAVALLLGSVLRRLTSNSRVPYSVTLLLVGLMIGWLDRSLLLSASLPEFHLVLQSVTQLDPHLILFLFLPTLIFESAYSLEPHLLRRALPQIALLALPGMLISALLTAVLVRWLLPWGWSWPLAFLFGALISATDPVAVVALLRDVSSRKRLETLLEGESLFNDGTAIVLFSVCFSILLSVDEASIGLGTIAFELLWTVALGGLAGWLCGKLVISAVGRIYNDPLVETTLSIACAYLVYFVTDSVLQASGVVAVVVFGLVLAGKGRARFSTEALEFLHAFWSLLAYMANTLIFLVVGLLIADRIELFDRTSWELLLALYLGLLLIRACTVVLLMPLLRRLGFGLGRAKALVLIWGGLRGAVALALALMLAQHPGVDSRWSEQVLFLTAGIVTLTILINGSSMGWLFARLGLDRLPPGKQAMIDRAEQTIQRQMVACLPEFKKRSLTQLSDWQEIERNALAPIVARVPEAEGSQPARHAAAEREVEYRRRLLEHERSSYWLQYREGFLAREATSRLIDAVDQALDGEPRIYPRPQLQRYWNGSLPLAWLHRVPFLERLASRIAYRHLILGYDMARGFVQAQNAALAQVDALTVDVPSACRARAELVRNKHETYAMLLQLKNSFPEWARQAELHSAQRTLLIQKRAMVEALQQQALLDPAEAERMLGQISLSLQQRHFSEVETVLLPDPLQLIRDSVWAAELSPESLSQLLNVAQQRIYQPQDMIVEHEEQHRALILVVRGVVERVDLDNETGEARVLDVLGPGCYAGFSALFVDHHHTGLRAAGPVDLLWIPAKTLHRIMVAEPALKQALLQMGKKPQFQAL
ncbi:MAG: NhaP-type Na+/H+ or K+/H+ antiporter/CRP-like cAMP-binding protein [Motiliproteus sp.]|jgi:NhaP-type Na+/H+ or K+/H+ antiporter/CRP-like cAMP-binding protein